MSQMSCARLKVPNVAAGFCVEGDDQIGKEVLPRTLRSVYGAATAGVAKRPIEQPQFRIDGRMHPGRSAASFPGIAVSPGIVAKLTGRRSCVELPHDVPGIGVHSDTNISRAVTGTEIDEAIVVGDGAVQGADRPFVELLFPDQFARGLINATTRWSAMLVKTSLRPLQPRGEAWSRSRD